MRVIKYVLTLLLFIGNISYVNAQYIYNHTDAYFKANSYWAFGSKAGLSFNTGGPIAVQTAISSVEGCAAVSDPVSGQLLFYSSGQQCWDGTNTIMPNGGGLLGNTGAGSAAQGVCIVPFVDTPGKYYLFSLQPEDFHYGNLYYSVVDMTLNNGLGDIIIGRKNIQLASGLRESMIAVPGNNCDYWLVTHDISTPTFKSYHINSAGIDPTPVISATGPLIQHITIPNPDDIHYGVGCTAVSPDRSLIALGVGRWDNYTSSYPLAPFYIGGVIARFDPATGKVSQAFRITENTQSVYGVCFSPDNSKLYVNVCSSFNPALPGGLYQYNVNTYDSTTIVQSRMFLDSSRSLNKCNYLKLYRDTIYASNYNDNYIDRINNPNANGIATDYQDSAIAMLPGTDMLFGLPNDVPVIKRDTISTMSTIISPCFSTGVLVAMDTSGMNYVWNDGTTGKGHAIQSSGIYTVQYQSSSACTIDIDTFILQAGHLSFEISFQNCIAWAATKPDDTNSYSFSWYDAIGNQLQANTNKKAADTIITTKEGSYTVYIASTNGCDTTMTIQVQYLYHPSFSFTAACIHQPVIFTNATAPEAINWLWNFGDNTSDTTFNPVHVYKQAGNYDVQLIASDKQKQCPDTFTQVVQVNEFQLQLTADDTLVNPGSMITLQTHGNEAYQVINWLPENVFSDLFPLDQTVQINKLTSYSVIAKSNTGCLDTATISIDVNSIVYIPSAFSPNGDGKNDYFRPLSTDQSLKTIAMHVYDRWGACIFTSYGQINKGWDGSANGKPMEIGAYYYIIEMETSNGITVMKKGDVTLIR